MLAPSALKGRKKFNQICVLSGLMPDFDVNSLYRFLTGFALNDHDFGPSGPGWRKAMS
jgi:hypothetical protein